MTDKRYLVYHLHSEDSLLDSCTKFEEYVDLAVEQGMTAIASTEHGKNLSWVRKKLYCDKKGIKFISGVEIYMTEQLEPKVRDNYHTILLAKNDAGRKELNKLVGRAFDEEHFYHNGRISFDEFLNISDNIIKTSACVASPLCKLPVDHPRYMELAEHYDFYEIQAHNMELQKEHNKRMYALSKRTGVPLIAGTDTHSSSRYKAECRKILMKYKGKSFPNEDQSDLVWKTYDELIEAFRTQDVLPEEVYMQAIWNTNLIDEACEDFSLDCRTKYPISYGSEEEDSKRYVRLAREKMEQKIRDNIIPQSQAGTFRERVEEELRVFQKLGMNGFMLSMSEILDWCRKHNIAIGPARGSVGGSCCAYVTDITDLNPVEWDTVFSRFCNEDRVEIGDIDIDVIDSDRPAIFEYITEKFGRERTARVGAYGTIVDLGVIDTVGGALRVSYEEAHHDDCIALKQNPWSYKAIDKIKKEYKEDSERAKIKYPQLFYYFDGLYGTRVSQSIHAAGIVISPIDLEAEYGVFDKDGQRLIMLDMEELHDVGAAKYDFLALKTIQVLRDTCNSVGIAYPRAHEIDWGDQKVWEDMLRSPCGVFQMESKFAFDCLKKFKPKSIDDMSLVTACIRPSGSSYRDNLLARIPNHNPSKLIDDLLVKNNGYLVYQCDVIKFLQEICGLSGSQADTIRRAIAHKDAKKLDDEMPKILGGYCLKSDKPEDEAVNEAKEFIKIIQDSAKYMFGRNHSIAYCMIGYMCAYFRYYCPGQFITAFLNCAANDDDIKNGSRLAKLYGIQVTTPKFGLSGSNYQYDPESKTISKGLSSLKGMGEKSAEAIYDVSRAYRRQSRHSEYFMDVLQDLVTCADRAQIMVLIKIGFFDMYGNQRELERLSDLFEFFKRGEIKKIKKEKISGSPIECIVARYSTDKTKSGKEAASYTILDIQAILHGIEDAIKNAHIPDVSIAEKAKNFLELTGYDGFVTGRKEDRPTLLVRAVYDLKRKKDGRLFGHSILTTSVGSGIEGRFTIMQGLYDSKPIKEGDVIRCKSYFRDDKGYYRMTDYEQMCCED